KKKEGPQPVGGPSGGKPKPNKILLGVLGLVGVVAIGHLAMPGMFGSSGHAVPFTAPLADRHLVTHLTTPTTVAGGPATVSTGRPGRNPFAPPPGYGS
ncbi:MAG TPA: hypothetical protein VMU14_23370, partial [Acidimicrobiales bacterium]|nr:hypothetical protein [Acidimicrobiales bacterium]